jgi:DNA-binding beta-propeller fold protein YncE
MQPIRKMKSPSGVRDLSVCKNSHLLLLVVYDTVRLYDSDLLSPIHTIKLESTPRSAKISQCGKYFYIHDSNNTIYLYDTRTATIIQQIYGVPISAKSIRFSKNS